MNTSQWVNLITIMLTSLTAGICAKFGFDQNTWQKEMAELALQIVTGLLWLYSHFFHGANAATTGAAGSGQSGALRCLPLLAVAAAAFTLTGCVSMSQNGTILSVTTRGLGVNIQLTSASSSLPSIQAGIFAQNVQFIPSSTNKLYSPDFASVAAANSGYDPFNIGGNEATASGISSTYNSTNVVIQPQTPMLWPTNSLK